VRNNILRHNKIGLLISDSNRVIAYNNIISNNDRGFSNTVNAMGLNVDSGSSNVTVSHNTLYRNGTSSSQRGGFSIGPFSAVSNVTLKNNIISETTASRDMWIASTSNLTSNYNDVYNIKALNIRWLGSDLSWSGYKSASGKDANSISADPRFIDPASGNFNLHPDSPGINAGDFLTKTSAAGNGISITVLDASYFSDGFGTGADGDLVKVGANDPVKITNVNYVTNTITVDRSISWGSGDGASYPYSGLAPDIGAYEYTGGVQPTITPTSTPTSTPSCPDGNIGNLNCDSNGLIDELDLSSLLSSWAPMGQVPTPVSGHWSADLGGDPTTGGPDGRVDAADLTILLGHWWTGE
jgi:hypothetical protein